MPSTLHLTPNLVAMCIPKLHRDESKLGWQDINRRAKQGLHGQDSFEAYFARKHGL